jgi:uncharacterized tellurite resistance protein B-like protein
MVQSSIKAVFLTPKPISTSINMTKEHLFNTYGEYILFLFIHVANADFTVKGSEIDVILSKMEDYFPEEHSSDFLRDLFVKLSSEYDSLNDSDIKNIIYNNYKKFQESASTTGRVFVDLHEVINADGYIDETEVKVLQELKSLLEL